MKQFFILGASSAYGVGGPHGGWGDLIKQYIHEQMYAPNGKGEVYEAFNFAKSGADTKFVLRTFTEQIKNYGRAGETTAIISVGGNNAKAVGTPENFVSTVEEYTIQMAELLDLLTTHCTHVLVVSNGYVDESKTSPKLSPFDGSKSYFSNDRRNEFSAALDALCRDKKVTFIDVKTTVEEWQQNYLYTDGLHPNEAGHQRIFEAVKNHLKLS